jgi:hypothetical protein
MEMATELNNLEQQLKAILDAPRMSKDEMRGRVLEAWGNVRRMFQAVDR